jgi:pyridoxine 4-dehydrogenase
MYYGMKRRNFLGVTLAGGAGILTGGLPKLVMAATSSATKSTFQIGGDLSVNRLGFGAMRLTGEGIWGWPPDRENAKKVLRRAVELGARPGPGRWVPNGKPEYLTQCVENSLKRLKLDRIDLYQLHRIDRNVPVEESLGAIKKMQDAGKIRHVGLSEVSVKEIEQAKKVLPIVSIQNEYNIADRQSDEALTYCEKEKMGFIPWSPIGGGRSSFTKSGTALEAEAKRRGVSVYQLALAWLLQRSSVMLPIPGTSSLAHLEENMASAKLQLTPEEWKKVESLT